MKKFKLLPSLIMLVLCVGVLAVGVYALTPISNTIAGTINISAGKASLAITGYVDGNIVYPRTELHGAMDWTIDSSKLNFNASNYCFAEDVPEKEVKLVIENLTDTALGVFFCDTANVNATESNIKTTGEIKSSTDSTKTIINTKMDYYKYIAPANANNTFDQAEMTITLSVASLTSTSQTGSFKYYLNIEEYDPELNATEGFVKISDTATEISANAFKNSTSLTKIIIPSSVTQIGNYAFQGCTSLEEITIPSSVTQISYCIFMDCTSLKEIIIPSSVTYIDELAFCGCTSLKEITIPSSVTYIDELAFCGCTSLKEITIPSSVTYIDELAFCGCTSLKEITIPSSVTSILPDAFCDCTGLTKIIVEAHNASGNFSTYLPEPAGTAWYIEGGTERQYRLSYSTSTLVFVRKSL